MADAIAQRLAKEELHVFGYWSCRRNVVLVVAAVGTPINCRVHVGAVAIKAEATGLEWCLAVAPGGFATERGTNRLHDLV